MPPSEEPWERIRPAPRPLRPPPEAAPAPAPPPPKPLPPEVREPAPVLPKPDRSRMDPLSLDRSGSRKDQRTKRDASRSHRRARHGQRIDRWLMRGVLALLIILLSLGIWSFLKDRKAAREEEQRAALPAMTDPRNAIREQTSRMVREFLAAPDAAAKSAWVLDRDRVLPLMVQAYATNRLPESGLTPGVPRALEQGVILVPAQVDGLTHFLLHLVVKEQDGKPLLDWETYEQEISQRFIRFAANPKLPGGDFRLVVERTHDFESPAGKTTAIRLAPPGGSALAAPAAVAPGAEAAVISGLPWNQRRRALVRLEWETPANDPPRIILREILRWDFLP